LEGQWWRSLYHVLRKAKIIVPKEKTLFICKNCGFSSVKWLGRCPQCNSWDSLEEGSYSLDKKKDDPAKHIYCLDNLDAQTEQTRFRTDIGEFDRVLGGGIVPGSLILLGGEPGIGKSTLLLQVLSKLSGKGLKVLYTSGEESPGQIKIRANRLGIEGKILLACLSKMEAISQAVFDNQPDILAVDSIQTVYSQDVSSLPGSLGQIKAASSSLMGLAKGFMIPIFIVGHVTKEGAIAGPKALEHLVDTVLYFEGDRTQAFRILRTVKNRFGPTHEIGIFEMKDSGLEEVKNPSNLFLEHRSNNVAGSTLFPCIEGTRPLLVEIQALVNQSYLALPRRTTAGFDSNRLALLTAVMEKHLGISLFDKDIFVNIAGGLKISEPAADLPLLCAILSSFLNKPVGHSSVIFGEVGLTGEIRPVSYTDLRINEAKRLGIKRCIMPAHAKAIKQKKMMVKEVDHIGQLPDLIFI